jgi:hypothetical protein
MLFFKKKSAAAAPAAEEEVPEPSTPVVEVTPPTALGHGEEDDDETKQAAPATKMIVLDTTPIVFFLNRESPRSPPSPTPSLLCARAHLTSVAGFVLLLMVSLSVPTINKIALLSIWHRGAWSTDVGVFGMCFATGIGG